MIPGKKLSLGPYFFRRGEAGYIRSGSPQEQPIELRISDLGVFFFNPHTGINNPQLRLPILPPENSHAGNPSRPPFFKGRRAFPFGQRE
jgi:hypothetical protein